METTAQIISELKAAGLIQAEIARRTGIPQPRLSRWENGASPSGAEDALKLLRLHAAIVGAEQSKRSAA